MRQVWLPVAQRELTVASRKRLTYWIRLVAPALGLVLLFLAAPELSTEAPAAQGKTIFRYGAFALFFYSTFAGLYFTAETISSERREGTLALLQLTGMRELDLVLGKLLASALPGIFGFFAASPLLAIPFLLGGVTPAEFGRVIVVLFGTLVLSLAAGIFASSYTSSPGGALKQTLSSLLSVFGLGFVGLLYFGLRSRFLDSKEWARSFYPAESRWIFVFTLIVVWYFAVPTGSPGFLLFQALFGTRSILPFNASFAIGTMILYGMAAYFIWVAKPFLVLQGSEPSVELNPSEPKPSPLHRRAHLPKGTDAFKWLLGPTDAELILCFGWGLIGGALHLFSNGLIYSRADESTAAIFGWGAFGVTLFIYFLFARRAAEFVVETRRSGMLEVLLVTPLSWSDLLARHRTAFIRFVWFPTTILLCGEILGVLAALRFSGGLERPQYSSIVLVLTVLTYICSLFATLWSAICFALRTKSPAHAALLTVLLVLVAPALVAFLFPFDSPGIAGPLFILLISAWLYIFFDGAIWAFCRIRLNRLNNGSPALICDRRAFRE
jgi:hypothetical protein